MTLDRTSRRCSRPVRGSSIPPRPMTIRRSVGPRSRPGPADQPMPTRSSSPWRANGDRPRLRGPSARPRIAGSRRRPRSRSRTGASRPARADQPVARCRAAPRSVTGARSSSSWPVAARRRWRSGCPGASATGVLGGRERTREDRECDQRERREEDEREAAVPPRHSRGRRRRGPGARSSSTPRGALAAAAAHPRGVVFRSTSAIASLRRAMVSGSTASGSRYGPSRSSTSLTRPRKTLASATKNCGSLL